MTHHPLPDMQEDLRIITAFCGFKELGQEPVYPVKPRFTFIARHYLIEPDSARCMALLMDAEPDLQLAGGALNGHDGKLICYTLVDDRVTRAVWTDNGEAVVFHLESFE
jgi:hypothetical protein